MKRNACKSKSTRQLKQGPKSRLLRLESLESRELLDAAGYHGAVRDADLVPTVVTTIADIDNPDDGYISLREAIQYAEANAVANAEAIANGGTGNNPTTVTFAPEIIGQVIKINDTLTISENITVDAWTVTTQNVVPGSSTPASLDSQFLPEVSHMSLGVTIDGAKMNFQKRSAENEPQGQPLVEVTGANVTLTGLTITNSNSSLNSDSFDSAYDGVGLLVDGGASVSLNNSSIRGLRYVAGGYRHLNNWYHDCFSGGAVVVKDSSQITATSVLIADNNGFSKPSIVTNSTGNNNHEIGFYSTGIDVADHCKAFLINCTVTHNNKGTNNIPGYGVSTFPGADTYPCIELHVVNTIVADNSTKLADNSETTDVKLHNGSDAAYFAFSILGTVSLDTGQRYLAFGYENNSWQFPTDWNTSASNEDDKLFHYSSSGDSKIFVDADNGDYTLNNTSGNVAIDDGRGGIYNSPVEVLYYNGKSVSYNPGTKYDLSGKEFNICKVDKQVIKEGREETIQVDKVDIGAYGLGGTNNNPTYAIPQVYVTIPGDVGCSEDDDDYNSDVLTDDFNLSDGSPKNLSLREAVWYMNRYWNGGNPNDRNSWRLVVDGTADPQTGKVEGVGYVWKTIRFKEGVTNVVVDSEIASTKTYTIIGIAGGDSEAHATTQEIENHQVKVNGKSGQDGSRIFKVASGTITADHLVLQNGKADDGGAVYIQNGGAYEAHGGAFFNNKATANGGAVYVAAGGSFTAVDQTYIDETVDDVVEFGGNTANNGGAIYNAGTVTVKSGTTFSANEAYRGGAIANKGTVNITGTNAFTDNLAKSATKGTFGGAIYNNGSDAVVNIGMTGTGTTTFSGNQATADGTPIVSSDNVLTGYSGGAIYNSKGTVNVKNAEFTSNFAGKYGGAISNFGTFTATGTTFRVNVASSGGAIQNAGSATINGCDFTSNAAYLSINRVVDGADFGGNGGAIFTSQTGGTTPSGGTIVFEGASTFNGNQAANAGGAIDYVSGTMTINGGMTFAKNVAEMVGGAFVAANKITFGNSVSTIDFNVNNTNKNSVGDIAAPSIIVGETTITASPLSNFQKTPSSGDAGYYAPTVAVTYNISTSDIDVIKSKFFSGVDSVGRDLLDTFTKYSSTTVGSIKYADLADSFKTPPTSIKVEVDGTAAKTLNKDGSGDTISGLATGTTHTVRYWDASNDSVKFTANIYVISDTTSVKVSQFDLSDWAYVPYEGSTPPNNKLPIGVTIQIFSNNPVSEWTIDWGDNTSNTYSNYGFTCNVYHAYTKGEATTNRTLKLTLKDGNTTVLNGAEVSTIEVEAASNAVLDVDAEADFFANLDLVDELFGE